jgi:hypothetical protein
LVERPENRLGERAYARRAERESRSAVCSWRFDARRAATVGQARGASLRRVPE